MSRTDLASSLRFSAPQVLTAIRATLGLYLIFLVAQRQAETAAVIWLFGLGTDVLDGVLARRLSVSSSFGELFDLFADLIYHVLAPATMSLFLLEEGAGPLRLILLSLPAPFASMRYARKAGLSDTEYPGIPASRGLATIVYGFYVVALVFLRRERVLEPGLLTWLLLVGVPVLSVLMMVRMRYPKLGAYPWILVPILTGLMIMPFFQTPILSRVMMGIVVGYVFLSPLLIEQHPERLGSSIPRPMRKL
jgi:CDP-diacylglycerol---serine O-phosphatidyltransferase